MHTNCCLAFQAHRYVALQSKAFCWVLLSCFNAEERRIVEVQRRVGMPKSQWHSSLQVVWQQFVGCYARVIAILYQFESSFATACKLHQTASQQLASSFAIVSKLPRSNPTAVCMLRSSLQWQQFASSFAAACSLVGRIADSLQVG